MKEAHAAPVAGAVTPDVLDRLAQFAPTRVEANLSAFGAEDRRVIDRLVAASREISQIFLRQAWADNGALREQLRRMAAGNAAYRPALAYFDLSAGPWDRLDEKPFLGDQVRPEGAGFYPPDLTKAEFESWIQAHPADAGAFKGLYTVIRRDEMKAGGLVAVPYAKEYAAWLAPAATFLKEAAGVTRNESLKKYLLARAAAFASGDYFDSDMAWMDLDSPIEITIGPYETYEDRLFGYKAAFESFVTIKDPVASAKLAGYKSELPAMERNLPIPDEHKNLNRGAESPIGVVDEVFTAGDTRAGVQTIAYNLPNDERVREAKGSKKILLRNVMDAKFTAILKPIAARTIAADQLPFVTPEAFFNETLFHELSHGLGPGKIRVGGRETEARLELKDLFSALEEAKADVMGVYNVSFLIGKKVFPESLRRDLAVTFAAGMFRSVRFGITEAHGQGVALQYNYLVERGAFVLDTASGRLSVDFAKFDEGIKGLVHDICMVQALGDYAGAKKLLDTYAKVPPDLQAALDRLKGIPVDIRPIYVGAGEE
ncbi:MAG: hypothetical protein HY049_15230 [Acidobacteria bacterium]|nr:hypothetical protein [Acidobacteriota bacterium]